MRSSPSQLPDGASLERTDAVVQKAIEHDQGRARASATPIGVAGFSGATFTAASNAAAIFVPLEAVRRAAQGGARRPMSIVAEIQKRLFAIQDGFFIAIKPPTVQGLGQGGGFKMQVQDRAGVGLEELEKRTQALIAKANQTPGLVGVFTTFSTRSPQLFVDVDRTKARMLGVPDRQHLPGAAGLCRLGLCQRLLAVRPGLPGQCPGRRRHTASTPRT